MKFYLEAVCCEVSEDTGEQQQLAYGVIIMQIKK
jgi:hypothetical protein